jgi:hypothetical protein
MRDNKYVSKCNGKFGLLMRDIGAIATFGGFATTLVLMVSFCWNGESVLATLFYTLCVACLAGFLHIVKLGRNLVVRIVVAIVYILIVVLATDIRRDWARANQPVIQDVNVVAM